MDGSSGLGSTGPAAAPDDYEVLETRPEGGGQGYLFRARLHSDRLGLGRAGSEVALKQLFPDAPEGRPSPVVIGALAARSHPHLGQMLEVFAGPPPGGDPEDRLDYVSSAWVPGRPLADAAVDAPVETLVRWVVQVGGAVDALHLPCGSSPALVHRDIKPGNVIITPSGDAVLIDPGLARPVGHADDVPTRPHGSPGYLPPECYRDPGTADPASDRWQVGALLYRVLVGEPPGRADVARLREQLERAPTVRAFGGRRDALIDAVLHALAADPAERPPSAERWALDLLGGLHLGPRPSTLRTLAASRRSRAAAAVAALCVVAGAVGWSLRPTHVAAASYTPYAPDPPHAALPLDDVLQGGGAARSRTVVVSNLVTNGATAMREDVPAYLSERPINFCMELGCALPNTDMGSGTRLSAVCQILAMVTTNGDDTTSIDEANPGRYTSPLWYGIRLPDGRTGFLSSVWLSPAGRGGLGLPRCRGG